MAGVPAIKLQLKVGEGLQTYGGTMEGDLATTKPKMARERSYESIPMFPTSHNKLEEFQKSLS